MYKKIKESKAYKSLEPTAQMMINKRTSYVQIQDSVIQARNIGIDTWKAQTGLPKRWQSIVEEIVNNEINSKTE